MLNLYKNNDGLILSNILNQLSLDTKQNNLNLDEYIIKLRDILNGIESDHAFSFYDKMIKTSDKKATTFLTEETLKTVIAVICIGFLVVLAGLIYFSVTSIERFEFYFDSI